MKKFFSCTVYDHDLFVFINFQNPVVGIIQHCLKLCGKIFLCLRSQDHLFCHADSGTDRLLCGIDELRRNAFLCRQCIDGIAAEQDICAFLYRKVYFFCCLLNGCDVIKFQPDIKKLICISCIAEHVFETDQCDLRALFVRDFFLGAGDHKTDFLACKCQFCNRNICVLADKSCLHASGKNHLRALLYGLSCFIDRVGSLDHFEDVDIQFVLPDYISCLFQHIFLWK